MTISARFTENDYSTIDMYRNGQRDFGTRLKQGFNMWYVDTIYSVLNITDAAIDLMMTLPFVLI